MYTVVHKIMWQIYIKNEIRKAGDWPAACKSTHEFRSFTAKRRRVLQGGAI